MLESRPTPNPSLANATTAIRILTIRSKVSLGVQQRYSNYQNIELENATTVCHQFKKLLTDKSNIPGSNNSQTQAGISEKMKELEWRDGAVEYYKKFYRLTVGS